MKTAVREQVNKLDTIAYFTLLAQLMKTNPPAAADAPALAKFEKIGLVAGKDFDAGKLLNADFAKRVPQVAFDRILAQFKLNKEIKDINGWGYTTKTGLYGTDYLMRAFVTAMGLGANRPQDAVYPSSQKDGDGKSYDGANKYVLRFPKGQMPPARGFWSLTMYDASYFFVANPINRYSISARQNLKPNPDGSVDLLHSEGFTRSRQGIELAAGSGRQVPVDAAAVLAKRERPSILDGQLEATRREERYRNADVTLGLSALQLRWVR